MKNEPQKTDKDGNQPPLLNPSKKKKPTTVEIELVTNNGG
jgi:hypothetical protein